MSELTNKGISPRPERAGQVGGLDAGREGWGCCEQVVNLSQAHPWAGRPNCP